MIEFSSIDDSDGAAHLNRVSSNDAAISHQDTQAMCLNTVHADLSRHNMLWRPLVDLAQCFTYGSLLSYDSNINKQSWQKKIKICILFKFAS